MALHKPEHKKLWWWLAWPFMTAGFILTFPVAYWFVGRDTGTWLRDWEDYIDDPIDWCKEALHGLKLPFGYELNISFLMMNRDTSWDVIRKQGDWPNKDPEDLP